MIIELKLSVYGSEGKDIDTIYFNTNMDMETFSKEYKKFIEEFYEKENKEDATIGVFQEFLKKDGYILEEIIPEYSMSLYDEPYDIQC